MAKTSTEDTIAVLEQILNTRRTRLRELVKRRGKIQKDLDKLDAEIKSLTGTTVKRRGRRTQNKLSLRESVLELLQKNKKGYSLADLSQLILNSGYKTTSTNFRNVLYQCLYNTNGIYHDEASGTYRYREPEAKPKPSTIVLR